MTTYYLGRTSAGLKIGRASKQDYGYTHAAVSKDWNGSKPLPAFGTSAAGAAKNAKAMHGVDVEVVEIKSVDRATYDGKQPAAVLSDEDRKQLADEAADRKAGSAPKDDFTMSDDELAKQRRTGNEQEAKNDAIVEGRTANIAALPATGLPDSNRCPHCGDVTKDNVVTFAELVDLHGETEAAETCDRTFQCCNCDGTWGPLNTIGKPLATPAAPLKLVGTTPNVRAVADKPKPARAPSGTSNGLKIEANRETRNGVTRPSIGGKCRGIWDMLDSMGTGTTAKEAREAGAGKFDKTTIMVQFYRWRKFNGIEGRQ